MKDQVWIVQFKPDDRTKLQTGISWDGAPSPSYVKFIKQTEADKIQARLNVAENTLKKLAQDQAKLTELNENALRNLILLDIEDARKALAEMEKL